MIPITGIILCVHPANEKWCYNVTSLSLMVAWTKRSLQYRTRIKKIISSDDRMNAEQSEALSIRQKVSEEISSIWKNMFKCGDYNNFTLQYLFWKRKVMGSYLPLMQNKLLGLDLNLNVLVLLKHTSLSSRPCCKVYIYMKKSYVLNENQIGYLLFNMCVTVSILCYIHHLSTGSTDATLYW